MTKTRLVILILASLLIVICVAVAQPARNVSAGKHPNLAAAQRFSQQAYAKIVAAQQANEWDMQGVCRK